MGEGLASWGYAAPCNDFGWVCPQTPHLARASLKPHLPLRLKSPSPFFESGLVSMFLTLSVHDLEALVQLDGEAGH